MKSIYVSIQSVIKTPWKNVPQSDSEQRECGLQGCMPQQAQGQTMETDNVCSWSGMGETVMHGLHVHPINSSKEDLINQRSVNFILSL